MLLASALRVATAGGTAAKEIGARSMNGVSGAVLAPCPFAKRQRHSWGILRRKSDRASVSGERLRGGEGELGFEWDDFWLRMRPTEEKIR